MTEEKKKGGEGKNHIKMYYYSLPQEYIIIYLKFETKVPWVFLPEEWSCVFEPSVEVSQNQ